MNQTRSVDVGGVQIGGGALPVVQSMCNTDTCAIGATLDQIAALKEAGCEIIRVAIPRLHALDSFEAICRDSVLPVVADVHFDYRIAVEAAKRGAAKLRINPGNIGSFEKVDKVIDAAKEARIPLRIGVNSGSLPQEFAQREDLSFPEKLAQSALSYVDYFEKRDFFDIVLSAKASSVVDTIKAYQLLAKQTSYPLHIGVTESGTQFSGSIKSAVGLGALLNEGIGDTLRVSLTADPIEEIKVAYEILAALDIRRQKAELVSCPTCGRCQVNLISLAQRVTERLDEIDPSLKIAVMGCVVNGPGESKDADFGIACGKEDGILFAHGEPLRKVKESELVDALIAEINKEK